MLRGLYIAGTGMLSQISRMNVVTNNIANSQTTGYKSDQLITRSFADMMIERVNDPAVVSMSNEVGPLNTGVHIDEINTDFAQGVIEETDSMSDFAIQGDAYFTIQSDQGIMYTRAGNFYVNNDGYLLTQEGYSVLGENGPVHVGLGEYAVDEAGNINVGGKVIDKLKLVSFDDESGLRKVGDNLYSNFSDQQVNAAQNYSVKQGYLEGSNVEVVDQMVDMMTIQNVYESNQKIIQIIDDTFSKAVNDIGRV